MPRFPRVAAAMATAAGLAMAASAVATDRVVLSEMYTATWCGPCQAVRDGYDLMLNAHGDTFLPIQYHNADAYTVPWGASRMSQFYGASAFPTYWTDGLVSGVGGGGNGQQWFNYFTGIMNQRLAVAPEVTMQMAAEQVGANQWEVSCLVTLVPGEPGRTVRVYLLQVLDDFIAATPKYRNTFRQYGASPDLMLVPGEPQVVSHVFTLDSTDQANLTKVKFVAFAQDPSSSGPAQVRNAYSIAHPFPTADCNGNGVLDFTDIENDASLDCDGDGFLDSCAIADGSAPDLDGNGIPDWCQDCNGNGTADWQDILDGTANDCNGNGLPDSCDVADGLEPDCNANGLPDACEVTRIETWASDQTGPLSAGSALPWFLPAVPVADLDAPVVLDVTAKGDLGELFELLTFRLNGQNLGSLFQTDGTECGVLNRQLAIDPQAWNTAYALASPAVLEVVPSAGVSANDCAGSYVQMNLEVQVQGDADADDNGVPDSCEQADCPSDIDGDGTVGFPDLVEIIAAWGPCSGACAADVDGNGEVGFPDLVELITAWGDC